MLEIAKSLENQDNFQCVVGLLDDAKKFFYRIGNIEIEKKVSEMAAQISEPLYLVVAGEYNSGKSSFVNALCGKRILRDGPTPSTNKITLLTHGDEVSSEEVDDLLEISDAEGILEEKSELDIDDKGEFREVEFEFRYILDSSDRESILSSLTERLNGFSVEDLQVFLLGDSDEENEDETNTEVKTFVLTGEKFKFVQDGEDNPEISVNLGDSVRIEFTSTDGTHDWVVDDFDAATDIVSVGDDTVVVEFVADEAGSFEYYCSVGNHRAQGMKGVLVVS